MPEFFDFSAFCGLRYSDGLFSDSFILPWIHAEWIPGSTMNDTMNMYMMGGEI